MEPLEAVRLAPCGSIDPEPTVFLLGVEEHQLVQHPSLAPKHPPVLSSRIDVNPIALGSELDMLHEEDLYMALDVPEGIAERLDNDVEVIDHVSGRLDRTEAPLQAMLGIVQ